MCNALSCRNKKNSMEVEQSRCSHVTKALDLPEGSQGEHVRDTNTIVIRQV